MIEPVSYPLSEDSLYLPFRGIFRQHKKLHYEFAHLLEDPGRRAHTPVRRPMEPESRICWGTKGIGCPLNTPEHSTNVLIRQANGDVIGRRYKSRPKACSA
jgi:hypothetical protein